LIFLALCIGLSITVGLKMLLTMTCRVIQYRKFYRVRPHAAKLSSIALECWHLGLGSSVLLARIGQFLFAALFWVGRTDVPFLSEDVNLFGYSFDYVPFHFIKDLLVHDAHRHPYIERLSQMYLMKLRHGDKFCSKAGSAWRQLLLSAIMPWITKYRVFSDERRIDALLEAKEEEERVENERKIYHSVVRRRVSIVGGAVGSEVVDVGKELAGAGTDVTVDVASDVNILTKSIRNLVVDTNETNDTKLEPIDET